MNDANAEFKLEVATAKILDHNHILVRRTNTRKRNNRQDLVDQSSGIIKYISKLRDDGKVEVEYTKPGLLYQRSVIARLGNSIGALMAFAAEASDLVHQCLPVDAGEYITDNINFKSGRIILSMLMHASVKDDSELDIIKLHDGFHEANFLLDLKATCGLWLPPIYETSIPQLECLYEICLSKSEFLGMKTIDRLQLFRNFIFDNLSPAKADQVHEILVLASVIDEQLGGQTLDTKRIKQVDPFNTVVKIFEMDQD